MIHFSGKERKLKNNFIGAQMCRTSSDRITVGGVWGIFKQNWVRDRGVSTVS
jgi:hypothetical protein